MVATRGHASRWGTYAALGIVAVLLCGGAEASSEQVKKRHHSADTHSRNQAASNLSVVIHLDPEPPRHDVGAADEQQQQKYPTLGELLLVGVGLIQAVVLAWQIKYLGLAVKRSHTTERAYIFPFTSKWTASGNFASFNFAFKNSGKTPGIVTEYYYDFRADDPPKNEAPNYPKTNTLVKTDAVCSSDLLFQVGDNAMTSVNLPVFFGYVLYTDMFKRKHSTRFCTRMTQAGEWKVVGAASWNEYD